MLTPLALFIGWVIHISNKDKIDMKYGYVIGLGVMIVIYIIVRIFNEEINSIEVWTNNLLQAPWKWLFGI